MPTGAFSVPASVRIRIRPTPPPPPSLSPETALVAAPVLEERFDKSGTLWTPEDLDKQLGSYFADRDPSVGFAADSIMKLSAQ